MQYENMKRVSLTHFMPLLIFIACSSEVKYDISWLKPEEMQVDNTIDGISYEPGNWEEISYTEATSSLGNHRAVVKAPIGQDAVLLQIPWRRRDTERKQVIIVNAETGVKVKNLWIRESNLEFGDIIFKPEGTSESYYAYYFPFETTGGYYPTVTYLKPENSGDADWLEKMRTLDADGIENLPKAEVSSIQSINEFNSFFPMEIVAGGKEVASFISKNPQAYYLFPEYRTNPTKMTKYLPRHWVSRELKNGISDDVKRGEFYVFQIAVYAATSDLKNLSLEYTDLHSGGNKISKGEFQCINIDGVDLTGNSFTKNVDVQKEKIQPLWIGLNVAEATKSGDYTGMVIVKPEGQEPDTIHLDFNVTNEIIKDYGDDAPQNMSRLRWFNSTVGSEDDFIISPFLPVTFEDKTLNILGRDIELDASGLPSKINSYFKEEMTGIKDDQEPVLSAPVRFEIIQNDQIVVWASDNFDIKKATQGRAEWSVANESTDFYMNVEGILEYDGMLNYRLSIVAKNDIQVQDMKLTVPLSVDAAKYMLGLGFKGTSRPEEIDWKWDVTNHHEGIWLGNVNKGLQYVLRDNNYQRPLNTNFYQSKPLNLPPSWGNNGKGGIKVSEKGDVVLCENYSGPRSVAKGDTLHFNVRFLITPFKYIDTKKHFNTRFVHKYVPVDSIKELGGTVVNVHHANEINPYINYPFYNLELQKAYIDEAHSKGIKVKLYNTIRELTYKSYELFPMRSLGFEIFNDGEGGGHPWLQEHLEADYHKAWHATRVNDASILNKGTSRWTNYYIEGLNWLAKNQEMDGLYLDDIAFSRETVKRMVAVLNRHREEVIIDLHSANQFNERDGFINSAFLYMEHFPYISRLWFGEYFEYDLDPDYWLTEVSGIPFGLTGEMLQDGGHPYRGMVYGMTTRVYGKYSPQAIWKLFDDFRIMDSEMIGYWVESNPVKTNNPNVPVTVYKNEDAILLALGSWSDKDEMINLEMDWNQLPFGASATTWLVPEVAGLQEKKVLEAGKLFKVEQGQGLFVIIAK